MKKVDAPTKPAKPPKKHFRELNTRQKAARIGKYTLIGIGATLGAVVVGSLIWSLIGIDTEVLMSFSPDPPPDLTCDEKNIETGKTWLKNTLDDLSNQFAKMRAQACGSLATLVPSFSAKDCSS